MQNSIIEFFIRKEKNVMYKVFFITPKSYHDTSDLDERFFFNVLMYLGHFKKPEKFKYPYLTSFKSVLYLGFW